LVTRLDMDSDVVLSNDDVKIDWAGYKEYLEINCIENTVKDRYNYSVKYQKYLLNLDTISDLMTFSPNKRLHIMKALSSLSKYCGCSNRWKEAIKKHAITWSSGHNSFKIFNEIVNQSNYSDMLKWIKRAIGILGESQRNMIIFNTLTGLRPNESIKCIGLLHQKSDSYWNKEKSLLEHYKFPNEFIRKTKHVFISVVNQSIIDIAFKCSTKNSYNSLKLILKRRNIDMNMYYCRKVFATFLRNRGIEPEIIDLLQGRISSSVFVNHYYRPDINEIITKRVRPVLDELMKEFIN
jgi:hypothetical protein